jgi:2-phosphosulfolactate phosphatase
VFFDQRECNVRCEWGARGLRELSPQSDVVIVVDVLSFSTAVDIAAARGALVYPYPFKDDSAIAYAESRNSTLASSSRDGGYSLSPVTLQKLPRDYRLVLPSPNGSALCFHAAQASNLLTGCLRNASAVARAAATWGSTFAVIPAGETWDSGELRPGLEDLIGAGAVISHLPGLRSTEAQAAVTVFECLRNDLSGALRACGSGKELIERGFAEDVDLASELGVSETAPRLVDGAFQAIRA